MAEFKEWADLSADERELLIDDGVAYFTGLPGVVGAPLVAGPGFWRDVVEHLLETGWRVVAKPIKHYEAPTGLDAKSAAGQWVYDKDQKPAESHHDRVVRQAAEQRAEYLARVDALREAGQLPPKDATPSQRAAFRRRKAERAEARLFAEERKHQRESGTLKSSPVATVKKPKRKK